MTSGIQQLTFYDADGNELSTVDLETPCQSCYGAGVIVDTKARTFTDCDQCGAVGKRISWEGQQILRFIRDWAGHPDIDREIDW